MNVYDHEPGEGFPVKKLARRMLALLLLTVLLLFLAAAAGGCMTAAEREFVAADCRAIGLYVQAAQPAAESWADALEASGQTRQAAQLRADTRALAAELRANAAARLDKLDVEPRLVESAKAAVKAASALLDAYERYKARDLGSPHTTGQEVADDDADLD